MNTKNCKEELINITTELINENNGDSQAIIEKLQELAITKYEDKADEIITKSEEHGKNEENLNNKWDKNEKTKKVSIKKPASHKKA